MQSILGLDLGDNCGYCLLTVYDKTHVSWPARRGYSIITGDWKHKPTRFDSAGVRYERFEKNLRECLELGVQKIGFEKVFRHNGTAAGHVYGGYLSVLQSVADEMGVPFEGFAVQTIKKFATGRGNADKDAMIRAAHEIGAGVGDSHDAADAVAIARLCWERMP